MDTVESPRTAFRLPPWLATEPTASPSAAERSSSDPGAITAPTSPGVPSLFSRRAARVIVSTALAVSSSDGDIDIDRIMASLARGEAFSDIPRMPVHTNRRGVQVLLDMSAAMQPFLPDLARLPAQLARVVGPRVQTLRFARCPTAGVGPGMRPWKPYRPPAAGTPVLLVTDLGSGYPWAPPPAPPHDWARFVAVVRRAGCRPLALVPGSERSVDPRLASLLPVLPWDNSTTVRHAIRVAR